MKRINIIALGAAICLISCNSNTKTNNNSSAENATGTVAEANVENAPEESSLIKFSFKKGDEIPSELEGFTIERQTYMGPEGEDEVKFAIKKGDELVAELEPEFDGKTIRIINLFSKEYYIEKNLHVGSLVSDVLAAYPNDLYIVYTIDELIELGAISTHIQYYVEKDGYDGQLPEVYSIEGTELENPTFKPDAVVCKIRMW